MAFLGCARGHSVAQRRFLASQRNSPSPLLDTLPRRPILLRGSAKPWPSKRTATAARRAKSLAWGRSLPALKRCRFQMLDVVAFSFLPKVQSEGGELAGHRQADQLGLAAELPPLSVERGAALAECDRLQSGEPVAAAGAAQENGQVVTDQLAAAAGEDGRPAGEACPILLASVGGESSDAPAVCVDGAADRVVAPARRIERPKREGHQRRDCGGRKSVGDIGQPRVGSDPQGPPASQNWPPVRSVERRSGPNPNCTNPNCSCIWCRSDVCCGASAKSKMEIPEEWQNRLTFLPAFGMRRPRVRGNQQVLHIEVRQGDSHEKHTTVENYALLALRTGWRLDRPGSDSCHLGAECQHRRSRRECHGPQRSSRGRCRDKAHE